jgi:hypothetical protein
MLLTETNIKMSDDGDPYLGRSHERPSAGLGDESLLPVTLSEDQFRQVWETNHAKFSNNCRSDLVWRSSLR